MTEQTKTADRILWLDLETTDLDVQRCQVLEVGCVLTRGFADGLEVVSEWSSVVWPMFGETALEEMPPEVQAMHRASGLWEACLADETRTPEQVADEWLLWLLDQRAVDYTTTAGQLLVGGSGVDRFDIPIVERVFPVIAREFHWRRMDVSAMKLLLNETGHGDLIPKQTGQQHRALADAHWARTVALVVADLVNGDPLSDVIKIMSWGTGRVVATKPRRGRTFAESQERLRETLAAPGASVGDWMASLGTDVQRKGQAMSPEEQAQAESFLARDRAKLDRIIRGDHA